MTSVTPVNQRATCDAVYDESTFDRDVVPAGHFHFYTGYDTDELAGILFGCPCGCGEMHSVAFRASRPARPSWQWDGNREKPTLTPSINILQFNDAGERVGEHWHGWLQNGVFRSC